MNITLLADASSTGAGFTILGLGGIWLIGSIAFYFLPTIIACFRRRPNTGAIFALSATPTSRLEAKAPFAPRPHFSVGPLYVHALQSRGDMSPAASAPQDLQASSLLQLL